MKFLFISLAIHLAAIAACSGGCEDPPDAGDDG